MRQKVKEIRRPKIGFCGKGDTENVLGITSIDLENEERQILDDASFLLHEEKVNDLKISLGTIATCGGAISICEIGVLPGVCLCTVGGAVVLRAILKNREVVEAFKELSKKYYSLMAIKANQFHANQFPFDDSTIEKINQYEKESLDMELEDNVVRIR